MLLGLITSTITELNSLFMLSKVYTERLVTKKLCLSGFLDVLLGIVIDKCLNLFDVLLDVCIYYLKKKSGPLLPEGTVKRTYMTP